MKNSGFFSLFCLLSSLASLTGSEVGGAAIRSSDCSPIQAWLEFTYTPKGDTVTARAAWKDTEFSERRRAAAAVHHAYRYSTWPISQLALCLDGHPFRGNFLNTLQDIFFKSSIQRIYNHAARTGARAPGFANFAAEVKKRFGEGDFPLFRLTGHDLADSPADLPGGVHRATKSLFMSLSEIPASDWDLLFMHELLHTLDDQVIPAIETFSDESLLLRLKKWGEADIRFADLSDSDQAEVRRWIEAGLARSLDAEYRTWTVTLALYGEGKATGFYHPIPWMERILGERRSGESYAALAYRRLDQRKQPSDHPLLKYRFLQEAEREVLQKRRAGNLPPLGAVFSQFLRCQSLH